MQFCFLIPWLDEFKKNIFFDTYYDQSLMASRWYYAGLKSNVSMYSKYPNETDSRYHIIYDYFLLRDNDKLNFFEHPPKQNNILIFCECGIPESRNEIVREIKNKDLIIQYNPSVCNYLKKFEVSEFYRTPLISSFNNVNQITVPLGSFYDYCKKIYKKSKTIILDEPHSQVLKDFNKNLQHVYSYKKSIRICEILKKRDFKITTFGTRVFENRPLLESIVEKHSFELAFCATYWKPYLDMLSYYKSATLFFSHYQETHGFSVYDNLQMGNPAIVFSENFNPLTINQFQNGVQLSLYMEDKLCADIIEEFYNQYDENKFNNIVKDSYDNFSCDTFAKRLRLSLPTTKLKLL